MARVSFLQQSVARRRHCVPITNVVLKEGAADLALQLWVLCQRLAQAAAESRKVDRLTLELSGRKELRAVPLHLASGCGRRALSRSGGVGHRVGFRLPHVRQARLRCPEPAYQLGGPSR
eukprot:6185995-Pleurochrysis_carterae.AAC.4